MRHKLHHLLTGGLARLPALLALSVSICLAAETAGPAAGPVPVHIAGIRMVAPEQVLLFLADEKEERAVPMAVGRDQGLAIYLGKERAQTPRPMTHDLLVQILKALGAAVEKVTITEMKDDTYYAEIAIRSGKTVHRIDARPSDAIALAVRLDAPMLAAPGLLRSMSGPSWTEAATHPDRRLGLSVQELADDLAESLGASGVGGVLVASVRAGGAAEGAGVLRGDIVQSIDGNATGDLDGYRKAITAAKDKPSFRVWRDGRVLTLVTP